MDIDKILLTECIDSSSNEETADSILNKISGLAKKSKVLKSIDDEKIYQAFLDREAMGSTAISPRIAIPHCRLSGINDFVVGVLISKKGVDFKAIDNEKTFVFVFIVAPLDKRNEHVRLLSYISQYVRRAENVSKMINANDKESIRESIIRHTSKSIDIKQQDKYKLLNVIIQNEDKFDEILNIITEFEDSNITIIDASNAGRYLYHMPLFASFMQTDRNDFCRVITSTIRSEDIEELINSLSGIIEEKSKQGTIFFLQNIDYLYGRLEI
ncbi:MAG: PTS sugar transporter subunit IIA [Candidatus Cloacimonetes bacterium]|nr:PTS sugar transporter subunit IIA [Candidatus Cloacimonadota bacterium]